MALEMSSDTAVCFWCGKRYPARRVNFSVSYSTAHKGVGYLPFCKLCVERAYGSYLSQCKDPKMALRQTCRKFDLYWNEKAYYESESKANERSIISRYLTRLTTSRYAGKSYDDSLLDDGTLWSFGIRSDFSFDTKNDSAVSEGDLSEGQDSLKNRIPEITEDVKAFWGYGYPQRMYEELEQRRQYWMAKMEFDSDIDVGTEALIRQICCLEVDIKRDRIDGKPVDKSVNALNSLLGSANLKPNQKKDDADANLESTPFGVWIKRWENQRPVPEPDPELQDVDGIIKCVLTWFYGHLAKMLGIKNAHSLLYEKELERLRVERPEYDDEDDEVALYEIYGDNTNE